MSALLSLGSCEHIIPSYTEHMEDNEKLHNFQFSGPAFAMVRKFKPEIELSETDLQIDRLIKSGVDPLLAIVEYASSKGLILSQQSIRPSRIRELTVPSLVVITEASEGARVKSIVLLERHTPNGALVFEFRSGRGWSVYPYSILEGSVSGEHVALPGKSLWKVYTSLSILGLVVVLFLWNKYLS